MDMDVALLARSLDLEAIASLPAQERVSRSLLGRESGAKQSAITLIRTPPGEGSPEGYHEHDFEQIFYIVSGVMEIHVEQERFTAGAGTLLLFPAGVAHNSHNPGPLPSVHLAFNSPQPDPAKPLARRVSR